jgi:3-oxoacyl-[acyl-carrier protein] reductase
MTADGTVADIEASGGAAIGIEVDVLDHQAIEAMVARVAQEWGRVDILVVRMRAAVEVGPSTPRPAHVIRHAYSLSLR